MALTVSTKNRVFKFNGMVLSDPNPNMSVSEVCKFYAMQYPELTNANIEGPEVNGDEVVYTFGKSLGTKG